jgi:hypothetical protein
MANNTIKRPDRYKPLKKSAIKNMRAIFEGIRDGRLKHIQNSWHCGSAHCIFGWKITLDAARMARVPQLINMNFDKVWPDKMRTKVWEVNKKLTEAYKKATDATDERISIDIFRDRDVSSYAEAIWGLTPEESAEVAQGSNTIENLFEILEHFEQGRRHHAVNDVNGDISFKWLDKETLDLMWAEERKQLLKELQEVQKTESIVEVL